MDEWKTHRGGVQEAYRTGRLPNECGQRTIMAVAAVRSPSRTGSPRRSLCARTMSYPSPAIGGQVVTSCASRSDGVQHATPLVVVAQGLPRGTRSEAEVRFARLDAAS